MFVGLPATFCCTFATNVLGFSSFSSLLFEDVSLLLLLSAFASCKATLKDLISVSLASLIVKSTGVRLYSAANSEK